MNRTMMSLASLGLGAGLMYWLDPQHGRRRRMDTRNRAVHLVTEGTNAIDIAVRDLENRVQGLAAEAKGMVFRETATDEVVNQRARAKLGRVCSHPHLIETRCDNGRLILEGQVLDKERKQVLAAMARVRGVHAIDSWLEPFDQVPETAPVKQGARVPRETYPMRRGLTPATRLIVGCVGLGIGVAGLKRGGIYGSTLALLGGVFVTRSITNLKMRQLVGIGAGRRGIQFAKTIEVQAPQSEVFDWLSTPENFPQFMSHVREVRKLNGQYHWKVDGPAGTSFEWNASVTRMEPDKLLAWSSEPGAVVGNAGVIQCEPNRSGGTRVTIRMSYNPPAGPLGHGFAKLFGADPKKQMDSDLVRFKSLIEQGKATARGRTVHREEIIPLH